MSHTKGDVPQEDGTHVIRHYVFQESPSLILTAQLLTPDRLCAARCLWSMTSSLSRRKSE